MTHLSRPPLPSRVAINYRESRCIKLLACSHSTPVREGLLATWVRKLRRYQIEYSGEDPVRRGAPCRACKGRRFEPCSGCDASGRVEGKCEKCPGTGTVSCARCNGGGRTTCTRCKGKGAVVVTEYAKELCPSCNGRNVMCNRCGNTRRIKKRRRTRRACPDCQGDRATQCRNCKGGGSKKCRTCGGNGRAMIIHAVCRGLNRQYCRTCRGTGRSMLNAPLPTRTSSWTGMKAEPQGEEEREPRRESRPGTAEPEPKQPAPNPRREAFLRLLTAYSEQWKKQKITGLKQWYARKVREGLLDLDAVKKVLPDHIAQINASHTKALKIAVPEMTRLQMHKGVPDKLVIEFAYATFRAATSMPIDREYVEDTWKAFLKEKRRLGELKKWLKEKR